VLFEALALFRRCRPAVVHTHNLIALSPAVWLAARLSGARVVHTHHDLWLLCERATMTDEHGNPCHESQPVCRICKAVRLPKRAQLGLVGVEILPSEWLRERLHRSGPIVRSFATSAPPLGEGRVAEGPPLIAYVGALTPHKLGPLIEAFELAAGESPMKLVIAGSGPLARTVEKAAGANGGIEYVGQIDSDERDRLLERAAVLVIPSTCAETSPLVFFEALAAGQAVIASELGGIPELARFGNLVLVPPGDARALATALTSVLADGSRLAELRDCARAHAAEASRARFADDVSAALGVCATGA
jgi:glycosyltransferase involved in cell wall biosynthesis